MQSRSEATRSDGQLPTTTAAARPAVACTAVLPKNSSTGHTARLLLLPGSLLTLEGCGELHLVAETDALWVTHDGAADDWLPRAGEMLCLPGAARIRISAFAPACLRLNMCGWRWRRGMLAHADGRRERVFCPAAVPDQNLARSIGRRIAAFVGRAAGLCPVGRRMPLAENGWPLRRAEERLKARRGGPAPSR